MPVALKCKTCEIPVSLTGETRFLWVDSDGSLRISERFTAPSDPFVQREIEWRMRVGYDWPENEAFVCGQGCALRVAERWMDRATFSPAPPPPFSQPTEYAELTTGESQ